MSKVCVGIDVGGTTVKLGLFSEEGQVLDKWEIPSRVENKGINILPDIASSIEEKLSEKKIAKEDVIGAGLGVPGPVTVDGFINKTANLGWDQRFNVEESLKELLGVKVKAANDANVAALGEMWKGGAEGYRNVVLMTLGTGVGGGIIVEGKILTGSTGSGGEIGHMHVKDGEPNTCGCGNHGCLEQYASATGVVTLARRALEQSPEVPTLLTKEELSAKAVFDAVKAGDLLATAVAEQFGDILGTSLARIASVVDPEVFVIGGGVSKAGPVLIDYIQKFYKEKVFYGCENAKFVLASLGNDAGIYGAAKLVLD